LVESRSYTRRIISLEQRSQCEQSPGSLAGFDDALDLLSLKRFGRPRGVERARQLQRTSWRGNTGYVGFGARGNEQDHLAGAEQLFEPIPGRQIKDDDGVGGRRIIHHQLEVRLIAGKQTSNGSVVSSIGSPDYQRRRVDHLDDISEGLHSPIPG